MLIQNVYCENTRLGGESEGPLGQVYCSSTPQRSHATPGASSQGDAAQSAWCRISRGSCWQSAPNFPVSSVNGPSAVLTKRGAALTPSALTPLPSGPASTSQRRQHPALSSLPGTTGTRPSLAATSSGTCRVPPAASTRRGQHWGRGCCRPPRPGAGRVLGAGCQPSTRRPQSAGGSSCAPGQGAPSAGRGSAALAPPATDRTGRSETRRPRAAGAAGTPAARRWSPGSLCWNGRAVQGSWAPGHGHRPARGDIPGGDQQRALRPPRES